MLIDKKNRIVIPKAFKVAGSSMYTYFKNNCKDKGRFTVFDRHLSFPEIVEEGLADYGYRHIKLARHPFDYMVSAYYWAKSNAECPPFYSFEDFIKKPSIFRWQKQHKFWNIPSFDSIRFEGLPQSFQSFCEAYDIPGNYELGHEKRTEGRGHYSDYFFNEDLKEIVKNKFTFFIKEQNYDITN